MLSFIRRIFGKAMLSEETKLINAFRANPQEGYKALVEFFWNKSPTFKRICDGLDFSSQYGNVNVCGDIYGYEVTISPVNELLDCRPAAYHLTKKQAIELYNAILSCVPGSVYHMQKVEARIKAGQNVSLV